MLENLNALILSDSGTEVLAEMRSPKVTTSLLGLGVEEANAKIRDVVEPLLAGAALPMVVMNQYRWFLQEMARQLRTRSGGELAFHAELILRKWQTLGLEPNTMQLLLSEVWQRVRLVDGKKA